MNSSIIILIVVIVIGIAGVAFFFTRNEFALPTGATNVIMSVRMSDANDARNSGASPETVSGEAPVSGRTVFETDGVRHSIPLNEILSGGPGKDGIPSIDDPKFISVKEANGFLSDTDPGLGLTVSGESKFYPYRILVWHEIVNDTIADSPVLVTYCPLCATGIVFERRVNGKVEEFGVSGRLWQSNLLMYNRAASPESESLWSQVLGEAVVGVNTGDRLSVVRSDVVRYADWKKAHPQTLVLSQDTGASRDYGRDPYGNYYTSESVSFGAEFNDSRLHPKALVHGIEVSGRFKAYDDEALKSKTGVVTDTFAGKEIRIERADSGELRITADGEAITSIPGFWFSWLAVHPETELFK